MPSVFEGVAQRTTVVAYYYRLNRDRPCVMYYRMHVGPDMWGRLEYHFQDRENAHHAGVALYQLWQAFQDHLEVGGCFRVL